MEGEELRRVGGRANLCRVCLFGLLFELPEPDVCDELMASPSLLKSYATSLMGIDPIMEDKL